ncbi:hypothetical protein CLF_100391 [Clonorchis sinensis]|uniref:Uncharacterized protein n=1 Tax=Clonorchis sinensis TaxID=79923 RepID=G7Y3C2_CLOSI|nr:hypothetical protein CLF_100391 [Clonorchis sinensis]
MHEQDPEYHDAFSAGWSENFEQTVTASVLRVISVVLRSLESVPNPDKNEKTCTNKSSTSVTDYYYCYWYAQCSRTVGLNPDGGLRTQKLVSVCSVSCCFEKLTTDIAYPVILTAVIMKLARCTVRVCDLVPKWYNTVLSEQTKTVLNFNALVSGKGVGINLKDAKCRIFVYMAHFCVLNSSGYRVRRKYLKGRPTLMILSNPVLLVMASYYVITSDIGYNAFGSAMISCPFKHSFVHTKHDKPDEHLGVLQRTNTISLRISIRDDQMNCVLEEKCFQLSIRNGPKLW